MSEETQQPPNRRATDLPDDAPWWARWLDANFRDAWRWASVWWPGLCAAAIEIWAQLPAEQQQQFLDSLISLIPVSLRPHALASIFCASIVLRVLNLARRKEAPPVVKP